MTYFKPTVNDFVEIDGELKDLNERLAALVERLTLTFGQGCATKVVRASLNVSAARNVMKEKIQKLHPEVS